MVKKLMVATALTVSTTAMVLMAPAASRFAMAGDSAYPVAEDSVFMDEGDGEFAAPVAADVQAQPAKTATKTAKKKADKKADKKVASSKATSARKPASDGDDVPPSPNNLDDLDVNAMTEAAKAQNDQASAPAAAPAPAELTPPPAPQETVAAPEAAPAPVAEVAPEPAAPVAAQEEAPVKLPKAKNRGSVKHASVQKVAPVAAHGMFANTKENCPMLREPASESEKMITVKADRKIWVEEVDGSWVRAFNKAGEPGYVSKDCFQ